MSTQKGRQVIKNKSIGAAKLRAEGERSASHEADAKLYGRLESFGDSLRTRQGWRNTLVGVDAVRFYLMGKHGWTPSQLRAMSLDDLIFALTEEMHGWPFPSGAI